MVKKVILLAGILLLLQNHVFAGGLVPSIFNLPTFQTNGSGIMNLDVGHRYLDVNRHTTNINISLSLGIFDNVDLCTAYTFKNKDIIGGGKLNFLDDYSDSAPLSVSIAAGAGYKDTNEINNSISLSYADDTNVEARTTLDSTDRTSYYGQLILQKHLFTNRLNIGIVPTYAWNTNYYYIDSKEDYTFGGGTFLQVYVTDRVSISGELVFNIYGFAFKYMNYNCGVKYAGYRHTFSLWVGNSAGYSPVEYLAGNTTTDPKFSFAFTREFDIF